MTLDLTEVKYRSIEQHDDQQLLVVVLDPDALLTLDDPQQITEIATSNMVFSVTYVEVSYLFNQLILFALYNSVAPRE